MCGVDKIYYRIDGEGAEIMAVIGQQDVDEWHQIPVIADELNRYGAILGDSERRPERKSMHGDGRH